MADTGGGSSSAAAAKPKGGGTWFTRKIGPFPAWGWGAIAVGAYYWYTHYGPGASKQAQKPAGGGLKTYAPHITETITERGGGGHKKPPARRSPRAATSSPPGAAAAAVGPAGAARPPNPGGPAKKPGRHKRPPPPRPGPPPPPPAPVPPEPEQVASADYGGAGFQSGGPVNADSGQPVYWEWTHAHRGPEVPEPVQAYAPMTNGAVYEAGSTAAGIAAG